MEVGDTGLEPVTPSLSSKPQNPAKTAKFPRNIAILASSGAIANRLTRLHSYSGNRGISTVGRSRKTVYTVLRFGSFSPVGRSPQKALSAAYGSSHSESTLVARPPKQRVYEPLLEDGQRSLCCPESQGTQAPTAQAPQSSW